MEGGKDKMTEGKPRQVGESDNSGIGESASEKRKRKGLRRNFAFYLRIFLVLAVPVAIVSTIVFLILGAGNYSARQEVTLEGISIPTIAAAIGERQVTEHIQDSVQGALASETFVYATGNDDDAMEAIDLATYADFLIENEDFSLLEFDETSASFELVRLLEEDNILQIVGINTADDIRIIYAVMSNAGHE